MTKLRIIRRDMKPPVKYIPDVLNVVNKMWPKGSMWLKWKQFQSKWLLLNLKRKRRASLICKSCCNQAQRFHRGSSKTVKGWGAAASFQVCWLRKPWGSCRNALRALTHICTTELSQAEKWITDLGGDVQPHFVLGPVPERRADFEHGQGEEREEVGSTWPSVI